MSGPLGRRHFLNKWHVAGKLANLTRLWLVNAMDQPPRLEARALQNYWKQSLGLGYQYQRTSINRLTKDDRRHTMPPRIPARLAAQCCRTPFESSNANSLSSLFNGLTIQTRNASILSDLRDNRDAYNKRIRVGRGPSAGKGKTSGRGHKGQKQHGKVNAWFQGGQTPLIRQKGQLGFENL